MTDMGPVSRPCPACGSTLAGPARTTGGSLAVCDNCHRPAVGNEALALDTSAESIEYAFDDVTAGERAEATDLLVAARVPYRWDPGFLLQVPAEREHDVDVVFGHLTPENGLATSDDSGDEPTVGDPAAFNAGVDGGASGAPASGPASATEPAEWVADEEAVGALASLFDAADRLLHHPQDEDAAAVLADATGVVSTAPTPFGVNPVLWRTAAYLGRQLFDLVEEQVDSDDISAGADALRAVLRDHV